MSSTKEVKKQFSQMALVVTLFGPTLLLTTAMTTGALHLLDQLKANPDVEIPPMPAIFELAVAFCDRSAWVLAVLGGILFVAGLIAVRDPRRGRVPLKASAWFMVAAMILLGGLWSVEAFALALPWSYHAVGVVIHAVQAGAVAKAALFLGRSDVVRACDAGFSSS